MAEKDEERRGYLLPLKRTSQGNIRPAMPQALLDIAHSASIFGRAARGEKVDDSEPLDFAMNFSGGGLTSPKPTGTLLGMGGGKTMGQAEREAQSLLSQSGKKVVDIGEARHARRGQQMAEQINSLAGHREGVEQEVAKLNKERAQLLMGLTEEINKVREAGLNWDEARKMTAPEMAMKLRQTQGLSAKDARARANALLESLADYDSRYSQAQDIAKRANDLTNEYHESGSELQGLRQQYMKFLQEVYGVGQQPTPKGFNSPSEGPREPTATLNDYVRQMLKKEDEHPGVGKPTNPKGEGVRPPQRVPDRVFDAEKGKGAVPNNQDVGYRGFVTEMTPDEFLGLAPTLGRGRYQDSSMSYLKDHLAKGGTIGQPFLNVTWNAEKKQWQVLDHEGRHRMMVLRDMFGPDAKVPVHVIPDKGMRARHLTDEMRSSPFKPQE